MLNISNPSGVHEHPAPDHTHDRSNPTGNAR
jgi:hypothetical protein